MSADIRTIDWTASAVCAELHAETFPDPWSEAALRSLLAQPNVHGRLAMAQGPAGFILMRTARDEAEVLTLAVRPALRRLGLGAALLRAGETAATDDGAQRLFLEVSETNQAARRLYSAAGWREAGRRPRYYADGADAVLMEKTAGPRAG